jgi:pimeloyl-ACP methyl ester carboxylesterase
MTSPVIPTAASLSHAHVMLLNGVYGAPEHFGALRAALEPVVHTTVFSFRRLGLPDPSHADGFTAMVKRLDTALDALAPGAAPALLGFSLGGALALEYALTHPGRVSALILVNAFSRYEQGLLHAGSMPALYHWPPEWADPLLTARLVHGVSWLRRGLFHSDAPLAAIQSGVSAATRDITREDVRFQIAHLALRAAHDAPGRLSALAERIPVLLAASRDDLVVSPRHTEWLAATMPRARLLPPFAGGHAFFQHDARELAQAVTSFMASPRWV